MKKLILLTSLVVLAAGLPACTTVEQAPTPAPTTTTTTTESSHTRVSPMSSTTVHSSTSY